MAKNILVTGGAGYIGSHTVLQLLTGGYRMVVVGNLDNSSDVALEGVEELAGKFGDNLSFHQVDLCDKAALKKIFAETKFDAVIHFAGLKAVGESVQKPLLYYNNNLIGTITLLEVMAAHGCKNLVVSSFATFNGWPNEVPYAEEFPLSSTNPYGRTKLFIEEVCHDIYRSDSEWKIILLRYFHPVGAHPSGHIDVDPHGIPNNVMPFVQQVAVGGQPALTVFGNDYSTKDGTGHCFEPLLCQMASKPPTSEAIALTEKKIDMALDDIIKMSQRTSNKSKKQRRVPNENQKSLNNGPKERALKVQRYMDSRSSVRQGFLASRRSNVQGNQFPLSAENAKKAAIAPVRVGAYNGSGVANFNKKRVGVPPVQRRSPNGHFAAKPQQRQQDEEQLGKSVPKQKPQTLDSRFANVKAERMQVFSHKNNAVQRNGNGGWQGSPWTRRQFGN